jgi:hypothetical protein
MSEKEGIMAVSTTWYIPDRVILHKISGELGISDVEEMERVMNKSIPVTGHPRHQLIDISEMTKPPSIKVLRERSHAANDDDGYVIIIGKLNRMIDFIVTTFAQLTNFRILVVPTLEEALDKLHHLDPSLVAQPQI